MCELAWVAGFFEGDGSVFVRTLNRRSGRREPRMILSIGQTDRERLERVQVALGYGTIRGPYTAARNKLAKKPQWVWTVAGRLQVESCIEKLWPYLGTTIRDRIETLQRQVA